MMKKIFENPVLNISMFSKDDVVTVSGTSEQTAQQQAEAAINTAAGANTVRETITVTW